MTTVSGHSAPAGARVRRGLTAVAAAALASLGLAAPAAATVDPPEPTVVVDPSELAVGDEFSVSGVGYTPDSTVEGQTLDSDGNVVGEASFEANSAGAISESGLVPDQLTPGQYVVQLTDVSGATAQDDVTIVDASVDPSVTIEPNQLFPGDPFTLSGEGYTPSSTIQGETLDAEGNALNEFTAEADADGAFSQDLEVPADLEPGTYGVRMTDAGGATAETTATVLDDSLNPSVSVDPSELTRGQEFTLSGEGYTPNADVQGETLDADGNVVGESTVQTDADGAFTARSSAIELEPGEYVIRMTDPSGATAETTVTYVEETLDPSVSIEPDELAPGDAFTLSGEGYTPNSTIHGETLDAEGNALNEFTAEADADGTFSQDLVVPEELEPGTYGVRMTDVSGATAETTATVVAAGNGDDGDDSGQD